MPRFSGNADYKFKIKCPKLKMANIRWRTKLVKWSLIGLKINARIFWVMLITNPKLNVKNSKRRIQDGGQK